MDPSPLQIEPIGVVHSCFSEKFGIPRQPGLVKSSSGEIELFAPFAREECVRGLEGFSHIWVQFLFHQTVAEGWQATVRPPWLGGRQRVGIFASRSPHRPNHLGLSAVRLTGIRCENKQVRLAIAGHDLLDQTPVLDLKPYLPYSDRIEEATSGFVRFAETLPEILFSEEVAAFCHAYEKRSGRALAALIREILAQDPRPASQRGRVREYGMLLWDLNVRWRVEGNTFLVFRIDGPKGMGRASGHGLDPDGAP